ncbi:MarR family transcriptional regulator [Devosia sp. 2618]|uniref:GbsR/MarR family transcriptional regulator n=1 Tax=Devosia sp. 2618 TaxID=3156454 RepID=UPI003395D67D
MSTPESAEENFIEQMGLITQVDGGPRIAGRILGLLLVEGTAFNLSEMAKRLKISKASASTNARMLEASGIIRRTARPGDRQDYYELGSDPFSRMISSISTRMRDTAGLVLEAEAQFLPGQEAARARVHELADFYMRSAQFMAGWSAHIKHQPSDAPTEITGPK